MRGITISYDEYGKLCEDMPHLSFTAFRAPTDNEIGLLTSKQAGYFLGMSVFALEKDGCIPDTEGGRNAREKLNDQLDEAMEYIQGRKQQETSGINVIEYTDYQQVYDSAKKIGFIQKGVFPTMEDISEILVPNMKFCFGFALTLLLKNQDIKKRAEYKALREAVLNSYVLHRERKLVEIPEKKYLELCGKLDALEFPRDGWWPTMEDIEMYIRPNYVQCFDFILWLLRTGTDAKKNPDTKASYIALRRMFDENTFIDTGKETPWL